MSDNQLLKSLCEALGFEVVETTNRVDLGNGSQYFTHQTSYKLERKKEDWIPVDKEVFGILVNYIISHQEDIEAEVDDFGSLKPIWDWFNRNSQ